MVPFLSFNNEVAKRFKALIGLEEKIFTKLVKSLGEELDGFAARASVYEYATENVSEFAPQFALALEAVLPLVLNEEYAAIAPDDVIKGVLAALERADSKLITWTLAEKKLLKVRLKKILSDTTVRLRAKTWALVLERPCVLNGARILTDLRPVFGDKSTSVVEACTVIHTLVVDVLEGGDMKTLHIALDTKDLASLRLNIGRAEQKEKVLNSLASRAGVVSLQIK